MTPQFPEDWRGPEESCTVRYPAPWTACRSGMSKQPGSCAMTFHHSYDMIIILLYSMFTIYTCSCTNIKYLNVHCNILTEHSNSTYSAEGFELPVYTKHPMHPKKVGKKLKSFRLRHTDVTKPFLHIISFPRNIYG